MGEVAILVKGNVKYASGKGSRKFNQYLKEKIIPVIMETFAEDVQLKAREHASGISLPLQRLPEQATHPIGKSESGNILTGFLEHSIELNKMANFDYQIISTVSYASWVEFGTGIFGPTGQKIKPVTKQALKFTTPNFGTLVNLSVKGQRPNPFMRGAKWYIIDNSFETIKKIKRKL